MHALFKKGHWKLQGREGRGAQKQEAKLEYFPEG